MTLVFATARLPDPGAQPLVDAGFQVDMSTTEVPMDRTELLRRAAPADAVISFMADRIDDEFFDAAPNLRLVAAYAAGVDNIDLAAAGRRGIVVTNAPNNTETTADQAWALLMAAARRVVEGDHYARSGRWEGWRPSEMLGAQVSGTTMLVVGLGRIGTAVARRARGFAMQVLYVARSPKPDAEAELGAQRVSLLEGLAVADHVVVTASLSPETKHLIDATALAAMKPTAILVNVGRGPLIDEPALVAALASGQIAGAGLDVYENEPSMTPGLVDLANVVLAPHAGSATVATRAAMTRLCCENVRLVMGGDPPLNPVVSA